MTVVSITSGVNACLGNLKANLKFIQGFARVTIFFDQDDVGREWAIVASARLAWHLGAAGPASWPAPAFSTGPLSSVWQPHSLVSGRCACAGRGAPAGRGASALAAPPEGLALAVGGTLAKRRRRAIPPALALGPRVTQLRAL